MLHFVSSTARFIGTWLDAKAVTRPEREFVGSLIYAFSICRGRFKLTLLRSDCRYIDTQEISEGLSSHVIEYHELHEWCRQQVLLKKLSKADPKTQTVEN